MVLFHSIDRDIQIRYSNLSDKENVSYNNQLHVLFYVIYVQTIQFDLSVVKCCRVLSNGFERLITEIMGRKKGGEQVSNERRKRCDVS